MNAVSLASCVVVLSFYVVCSADKPETHVFRSLSNSRQTVDALARYVGNEESYRFKPCVFAGHVTAERNWHGYIANLTFESPPNVVVSTGRRTRLVSGRVVFDFRFPADSCCPTVTFYSKRQASAISAGGPHRLSCWQRENLAKPEDDQLLRLTPRFPWSGCHVTDDLQLNTSQYVCSGGRSFVVENGSDGVVSSSWYVAVSNCAKPSGLRDFRYRMMVYGQQNGECETPDYLPLIGAVASSSRGSGEQTKLADRHSMRQTSSLCVFSGSFEASTGHRGQTIGQNISIEPGGGFEFRLSYDYLSSAIAAPTLLVFDDDERIGRTVVVSGSVSDVACQLQSFGRLAAELGPSRPECDVTVDAGRINVACAGRRAYRTGSSFRLVAAVCGEDADGAVTVHYRFEMSGLRNANDVICSAVSMSNSWALNVQRRASLVVAVVVSIFVSVDELK